MNIKTIYGINYDSNIYVIDGEKPTIIDCGTGMHHNRVIDEIKDFIELERISQIILTHEHFDHTGGAKKIKEELRENTKVISHRIASEKIEKGESDFARMLGSKMEKTQVDIKLDDKDKTKIGNKEWLVIYTPGHTPGSICLYEKDSKSLISGDTIFSFGSFGRYDFPGGNLIDLKKSIEKISKIDIENLYPGHERIVENDANKHIQKSLQNISCI